MKRLNKALSLVLTLTMVLSLCVFPTSAGTVVEGNNEKNFYLEVGAPVSGNDKNTQVTTNSNLAGTAVYFPLYFAGNPTESGGAQAISLVLKYNADKWDNYGGEYTFVYGGSLNQPSSSTANAAGDYILIAQSFTNGIKSAGPEGTVQASGLLGYICLKGKSNTTYTNEDLKLTIVESGTIGADSRSTSVTSDSTHAFTVVQLPAITVEQKTGNDGTIYDSADPGTASELKDKLTVKKIEHYDSLNGSDVASANFTVYSDAACEHELTKEDIKGETTVKAYVKTDSANGSLIAPVTLTITKDTVASLSVTTQPTKMSYTSGEEFDNAGLVVKATYASGNSDANYTNYDLTVTGASPAVTLTSGTTPMKVAYNGKTITVTAKDPTTAGGSTYATATTSTLTVNAKEVEEPSLSTSSFSYSGAAQGPTLSPSSSNDWSVVVADSTTSATNAGSYSIKVELTDKNETKWKSANTTNDQTLDWSITKLTPELEVTINDVTMRGKDVTVTVTIKNPEGATTGFPAASNVKLTATVGDGAPSNVALKQTGTTGVYTGTYTLLGDEDAVGKKVTFSATTEADTNYEAQTSAATKEITITDKNVTTTTLAVEKGGTAVTTATYGDEITLTATVTAGVAGKVQFKKGGSNLGDPVAVSDGKAVKTLTAADLPYQESVYSLTAEFTPDNTAEYKNSESSAASLSIGKKELSITGLTATDRAYDTTTTVALTGGTLDGKVGSDDVSVTMPTRGTIDNANASDSAKTVTVTKPDLSGTKAGNYTLADLPAITVTISKADPTVGTIAVKSGATLYTSDTLDEAKAKLERTGSEITEGNFNFASGVTALTAGTKSYSFDFTPTDTTNYNTKTVSVSLTVSKDDLSGIAVTTAPTKTAYTYGDAFEKTGMVVTATYASGKTKALKNDDVTVSALGDASETPKTLTVSYTEDGVTKTANLTGITVGKKEIPVGGLRWTTNTFTYDGTEKTVTIEPSTIPVGITLGDYTNNKGSNAGTYNASVALTATDATNFAPSATSASTTLTIAKANQTPSVTSTANLKKDGDELDLSTLVSGYAEGSAVEFAEKNTLNGTSLDTATGVLTSGDTEGAWVGTVTITKDNYNKFIADITVNVTNKDSQAALVLTPSAKSVVYGDPLTLTQTGGSGNGAVTYDSSAPSVVEVDSDGNATVKSVGAATITATKAAAGNYAEAATSVTVTVTKRPLTITAKDVTVTVGSTASISNTDYTLTGSLASGDTLSVNLVFNPTSPSTAAVSNNAAQTVASGAAIMSGGDSDVNVTDNYEITYINGKLIVKPATVTVTFDANGGTVSPTSAIVTTGGTLSSMPTPTRSGYTFAGWFDAASGGTQVTASTPISGGMTLYAHWTAAEESGDVPFVPYTPGSTTTTPSTTTTTNADGSTTTTTTAADGTTTTTNRAADGSTTETVIKPDGSAKVTARNADGSESVLEIAPDGSTTETGKDANGTTATAKTDAAGNLTEAKANVTNAAVAAAVAAASASNETPVVTIPVTVPAARSAATAAPIAIEMPGSVSAENPVKVEIPVEDVNPSTVVVVVNEDGTEEIVKDCTVTEDGVVLGVEGDVTVKVVDNTKTFVDPIPTWAEDSVQFVTSREIFNGTGNGQFDADTTMSRGMIAQVLFNFDSDSTVVGSELFPDAEGKWFDDAANWAASVGVVKGDENGNFNGDAELSRQDLAVMLYRYAQAKGYDTSATASLASYSDASKVAGYAEAAMEWAVANGIITGTGLGLEPTGSATRAQVAAMIARFVNNIVAG